MHINERQVESIITKLFLKDRLSGKKRRRNGHHYKDIQIKYIIYILFYELFALSFYKMSSFGKLFFIKIF